MIINRTTTSSITLDESSVLMIIVESLSMTDTVVVGSTQLLDIRMYVMVDVSIVVALTEQVITLALPYGGIYFDGH